MAFDFIKKVFSFGNRPESPREPERPREDAFARGGVEAKPVLPPPAAPQELHSAPAELPAQPGPAEIPPAPVPSIPAVPQELPAAPVEVPAHPGEPVPQELPATPEPVAPQAPPEIPQAPAEVPQPAPAPPEAPVETPAAPPAPEEPPAPAQPGPEASRLDSAVDTQPADEDVVPLEPEMPAAPSAQPPSAFAPSTAREKFGERVSVGRAVDTRAPAAEPAAVQRGGGWLARMRSGLSRSSRELSGNLSGVFTKGRLTEDFVEELEEVLIRSDFGADTAMRITAALTEGRYGFRTTETEIRDVMAAEIAKILEPVAKPLELDLSKSPHVILVVGVNGTGKTTTIGKLAAKLRAGGLSVMLAAGDTFRAAAIEQLKIWGERTGAPVVSTKLGADAAGLAFEAFQRARAEGADVLVIDTAGRLQNRTELMAELEKIVRVLKKLDPSAPHTVLQTLDATTGQNALNQVEIFRAQAGVNGLIMTKLDGTARGGILVAIAARHKLPVFFIGVGEGIDDLEPFSGRDFAQTIAGTTYG